MQHHHDDIVADCKFVNVLENQNSASNKNATEISPTVQKSITQTTDNSLQLVCSNSLMTKHPSTTELHICHSDSVIDKKIPKWALRIANTTTNIQVEYTLKNELMSTR